MKLPRVPYMAASRWIIDEADERTARATASGRLKPTTPADVAFSTGIKEGAAAIILILKTQGLLGDYDFSK